MNADEPVTQADLEARMRELSAAGGGELDMGGARVLITDPPLTVPSGVKLRGCRFEVRIERDGPGEDWSESYRLPDFATGGTTSGHVSLDEQGRVLVVEVGEGGLIDADDAIPLPEGGLLAEVPPTTL